MDPRLIAPLAQTDPASRAGDAALLHHRVEHDQEIEIEGAQFIQNMGK
jgi:hypothetical protein